MGRVTQKPSHKLVHCIHEWKMNNWSRKSGATTPISCQFHMFTCSFCLLQLVNCFTDVAVVVSHPGAWAPYYQWTPANFSAIFTQFSLALDELNPNRSVRTWQKSQNWLNRFVMVLQTVALYDLKMKENWPFWRVSLRSKSRISSSPSPAARRSRARPPAGLGID